MLKLKAPLIKWNSKVNFKLFSLLQLTDKINLTFLKVWQYRSNVDNTAQLDKIFVKRSGNNGLRLYLFILEVAILKIWEV